jgi:hypothetical protein
MLGILLSSNGTTSEPVPLSRPNGSEVALDLGELVHRINEIHRVLDAAKAAEGSTDGEVRLREAAIFACRTYTDVVQDQSLAMDLQRLRDQLHTSAVYSPADVDAVRSPTEEARQTLERRYRDLISAEVELLSRLGLDHALVPELERRLLDARADAQSELETAFRGADRFVELRRAMCDYADQLQIDATQRADELQIEATQGRKRKKLRAGLLGLSGAVIIGGNAALSLVTGGVALASTGAGSALIGVGAKEVFFGNRPRLGGDRG